MPLSNRTTPANGSERDQVIPLLDSVKVKTNKRGRPRKRLKVLAADKGYDSKDKRAALRKARHRDSPRGRLYVNVALDHNGPSEFGRQRRTRADLLKFPSHVFSKSVVSHGFKKNIVVLLSGGKGFLLVLMLFCLLQQSIFGLTKLY